MTSTRIVAAVAALAAAAITAPAAAAFKQPQPLPTYIWNGHGYTRHPPSSLRLGRRVHLTNIEWDGGTGPDSGWGWLGEPNNALLWPSHWYRTSFEVESFDVCAGAARQYVLTIGVWLPPRRPLSPLVSPGRPRLRKFALPVPAC
jgi:hypothetical protein